MRDQHAPIPRDLKDLWEDLQTDESDGQCFWTDISPRAVCALIERIAKLEAKTHRLAAALTSVVCTSAPGNRSLMDLLNDMGNINQRARRALKYVEKL